MAYHNFCVTLLPSFVPEMYWFFEGGVPSMANEVTINIPFLKSQNL